MHLELSIDDLPYLKTNLKKYHPEAQASRRIEAAARGLGFKSYAALLHKLKQGPTLVEISDANFCQFLEAQEADGTRNRSLSRSMLRIATNKILEQEPRITARGFDSLRPQTNSEMKMSLEERQAAFEERRNETTRDLEMDELELALIYLDMQDARKTLNKDYSSYSLKHRAENLSRKQKQYTHLGDYVSNGMLIIAAKIRGFKCKQVSYQSPNAFFNISSKTVRATAGEPVITIGDQQKVLGPVDKRDSQKGIDVIQDFFLGGSSDAWRFVGCGMGIDRVFAAA